MTFKEEMELQGYRFVRKMKNDEWVGICKMVYTWGLIIGLDEFGYKKRYCYEFLVDVVNAAVCYDGKGDPSGPWIKVKGDGEERMGPGTKEGMVND